MIKILKNETIQDLKNIFENENELSELIPETAPSVEVVTLDLIRIYINDRIRPNDIKETIFNILRENQEPGPLKIHIETAKTCRLTLYAEIRTI